MCLKILQIQYKYFTCNCVEAIKQIFVDVDSFDRFENRDEIFQHYITFNKRRRRKLKGKMMTVFEINTFFSLKDKDTSN